MIRFQGKTILQELQEDHTFNCRVTVQWFQQEIYVSTFLKSNDSGITSKRGKLIPVSRSQIQIKVILRGKYLISKHLTDILLQTQGVLLILCSHSDKVVSYISNIACGTMQQNLCICLQSVPLLKHIKVLPFERSHCIHTCFVKVLCL